MEQDTSPGNLAISPDEVQEFHDLLNQIGSTPSISLRKSVDINIACRFKITDPSYLVSVRLQKRVSRHDRWYTEIFNKLFEEAARYDWKSSEKGPFTNFFWRWLTANQHNTRKEAILKILLHPHVRSLPVRAALGKRDYKSLFQDLQMQSLDSDVPNVIATYFLGGEPHSNSSSRLPRPVKKKPHHHPSSSIDEVSPHNNPHIATLNADMGYVGQAGKLSVGGGGQGAKPRMHTHRKTIEQRKAGKPLKSRRSKKVPEQSSENQPGIKKQDFLWASKRLAQKEIEKVSYTLLSFFPVPRSSSRNLDQMRFVLTLAEAVDIVILGTMDIYHPSTRFAGDFGLRIRPVDMPEPPYEGLNRTLPTKQEIKFFRVERSDWTPAEVLTFSEVSKDHQSELYGTASIRWDILGQLLRERGIEKPEYVCHSLYNELAADPVYDLVSFRTMKYRYLWSRMFKLKVFLESKQLLAPSKDDKDNYYHIRDLEGTMTFFQLETLLRKHGYKNHDQPDVAKAREWFQTTGRLLPHLLLKEVWDRSQGKQT